MSLFEKHRNTLLKAIDALHARTFYAAFVEHPAPAVYGETADADGQAKFKGLLTNGEINKQKLILVKPLTFMNNSGTCIREIQDYYKIIPKNVFVFHDDLDLELGKIRCKVGGSSGGHNGIKSIEDAIGPNFYRIRIGIGHPGQKELVDSHVLNDFSIEETETIAKSMKNILDNVHLLIERDLDNFSSKSNS